MAGKKTYHKINEKDAWEIRRLKAAGIPSREIAKKFKISKRQVDRIVRFEHWPAE